MARVNGGLVPCVRRTAMQLGLDASSCDKNKRDLFCIYTKQLSGFSKSGDTCDNPDHRLTVSYLTE